ncbi:hypothetical protein [Halodesulfovibrio aestuarii]|uniref:Uncharacterized protein n=1 Tax=Halodesulfovibrio aestuarii TaxID=126333 RepID=A0ABV4JX72_9BACT
MNPFLRSISVLSLSCPSKLSRTSYYLEPFSSIYTTAAALAASFFHVRRDGRGASDAPVGLSLLSPLPPLQETGEKSKEHQSEPATTTGAHRFFPTPELIGVVAGTLCLRMMGLEKTEKMKIVQLAGLSAVLHVLWLVICAYRIVSRAARKFGQHDLSLRFVPLLSGTVPEPVRAYSISLCRQYVVVPPVHNMEGQHA